MSFADMPKERLRELAHMGGKAVHAAGRAHTFTTEEAKAAGRKGGMKVAANRAHMAEIGRKGGFAVSRNREHMAAIGRKGGFAVSRDREHMAAIGKDSYMADIGKRGGIASAAKRATETKEEE